MSEDKPKRRKRRAVPKEVDAPETTAPETSYTPPGQFLKEGTVEYEGGCWCGKNKAGCKGGPVVVKKWASFGNFHCPHGRPWVDGPVPAEVKRRAREQGLVS